MPLLTIWTCLLLLFFGTACQKSAVFEEQRIFSEDTWAVQDTLHFPFTLETTTSKDILCAVRYEQAYRYCNLHLDYALVTFAGDTLKSGDHTSELFRCQGEGVPQGSGTGGWYDQELPLLQNFSVPEAGKYRLILRQQMRDDTLAHIRAVGAVVYEHKSD